MTQDSWAFQIGFNFMKLDVFPQNEVFVIACPLSGISDLLTWSISVMRNVNLLLLYGN